MSFRTVYGNTYSENGWRMCNRDECDIVRIPGLFLTDTAPIRRGAPLTILGAWMYWYDRNVEEITSPIWGWSRDNDVASSNHLAGTGIDLNAPRYPWGQRVMPAAKKAKVREGLRLFEGRVFWGADWDFPDEMHYQLAYPEGDRRNDSFASLLLGGHLGIWRPKPTPNPNPTVGEDMFTDEDRRMLRELHTAVCVPRPSLIDPAKKFDLPTNVQLIDAATFRLNARGKEQ